MIELEEAIAIHDEIIRESGGVSGVLFKGLLESCLQKPLLELYGYQLYQDIFEQVSALMHCIIFYHPFVDGNKRTGLIIAKMYLEINGLTLNAEIEECVNFTIEIAQGKKQIIDIAEWIRNHTNISV